VIEAIGRLMEHDTAGDPVSGVKWARRTTEKVADELGLAGIVVCPNTVAKLLKSLGYRLRANAKKLNRKKDPGRDAQFAYIAAAGAGHSSPWARSSPVANGPSRSKSVPGVMISQCLSFSSRATWSCHSDSSAAASPGQRAVIAVGSSNPSRRATWRKAARSAEESRPPENATTQRPRPRVRRASSNRTSRGPPSTSGQGGASTWPKT
jgi:hypothetical protein